MLLFQMRLPDHQHRTARIMHQLARDAAHHPFPHRAVPTRTGDKQINITFFDHCHDLGGSIPPLQDTRGRLAGGLQCSDSAIHQTLAVLLLLGCLRGDLV